MRNNLGKKVLFTSTALLVTYILTEVILGIFGLQLRAWINVVWLWATFGGFVLGVILIFIMTRKKTILFGMIATVALVVGILFSPVGIDVLLFFGQIPHKEYVTEIDGHKFVGYEDDVWDVCIDFYDYKNPFVSGTEKRFTACGSKIDDSGNRVFYDDFREYRHWEDIFYSN